MLSRFHLCDLNRTKKNLKDSRFCSLAWKQAFFKSLVLFFCVYSAFLINLKAKVSLNEKEKLTHEFRNLLSEVNVWIEILIQLKQLTFGSV